MTLHANLSETDDFMLITIFTTSPGDAEDPGFYEIGASTYDHTMLLAHGKLTIREDNGLPYVVEAPGFIHVKPGVSYWFQNIPHGTDPLQPNVLYCFRNETTPEWDVDIKGILSILRRKNEKEAASIEVTP